MLDFVNYKLISASASLLDFANFKLNLYEF